MTALTAKPKIVFLDTQTIPERFSIAPPAHDHEWQSYAVTTPVQVTERAREAHTVITSKVKMDRTTLQACPNLRHIAVAATGHNIVDLSACKDMNIAVSNIPSYTDQSLAEHVLTCIFSLRRKLARYQRLARDGTWHKSPIFCVFDQSIDSVAGSRLGIIGYGSLGKATAALAASVGMRISVYSPHSKSEKYPNVSLENLLMESDIVSLHCELNQSTRDLIDLSELQLMQNHAILINTARGGVVNESALKIALEERWIAGAAIDVLEHEPPRSEDQLMSIADRDNVIITPHIAWANDAAIQRLCTILSENISRFLSGQPQNIVQY